MYMEKRCTIVHLKHVLIVNLNETPKYMQHNSVLLRSIHSGLKNRQTNQVTFKVTLNYGVKVVHSSNLSDQCML